MDTSIIASLLFAVAAVSAQECPTWVTNPECYNDHSCSEGYLWEENVTVCGLTCGACIKYSGLCDSCDDMNPCQPGYECSRQQCNPKEKSCPEEKNSTCVNFSPVCVGEEYAPRQCKGVKALGRCFCVDKQGQRIFGEQEWAKAENMTCACSRRVEELKVTRKDVMLHCNEQGNYETLQCDDGLCWCADEKTGIAISRILPESMMTMLYCYNETEIGSQYLRICESKVIAQYKIEIEMNSHGTQHPNFQFLTCDRDGSYSAVQLNNNQIHCVWKDNAPLGGYAAELSDLPNMNCRCARDKKKNPDIQLICSGNGNYQQVQYKGDAESYFVDEDGFLADYDVTDCQNTFMCPKPTTTTTAPVTTSELTTVASKQ